MNQYRHSSRNHLLESWIVESFLLASSLSSLSASLIPPFHDGQHFGNWSMENWLTHCFISSFISREGDVPVESRFLVSLSQLVHPTDQYKSQNIMFPAIKPVLASSSSPVNRQWWHAFYPHSLFTATPSSTSITLNYPQVKPWMIHPDTWDQWIRGHRHTDVHLYIIVWNSLLFYPISSLPTGLK